jgi:hypothetical protein
VLQPPLELDMRTVAEVAQSVNRKDTDMAGVL